MSARKLVAGTLAERLARTTEGRFLLVKRGRGALHSGLLETVEFFRETEPEGAKITPSSGANARRDEQSSASKDSAPS